MNEKDAARFWSKVDKRGDDECWLWQSSRKSTGYGQLNVGSRRTAYAHRFSYELHNGPIPDGLCVCHRCDVRACCNPAHLFLGTRLENTQDMDRKGRRRSVPSEGETNGFARLTSTEVSEIRALYASGEHRQIDLARRFGTHQTNVSLIVRNTAWRTA